MIESELPPLDFQYVTPDRSLVDEYRKHYFYIFHDKVALLKTSFGCPYTCSFCFCREITRGRYHQRPLAESIAELESLPQKEIYIVDDDFLADPRFLTEFMDELESRQIRKHYLVYGRADFVAENPDLLERFRDLGLRTVIVGFESFFEEELEQYGKDPTCSPIVRPSRSCTGWNRLLRHRHPEPRLGPPHFLRLEKELKDLRSTS